MVKMSELRAICSTSTTYMEVYTAVCSVSATPYEVANYVWTTILSQAVGDIPRREDGKEAFERSVIVWQKKQKQLEM